MGTVLQRRATTLVVAAVAVVTIGGGASGGAARAQPAPDAPSCSPGGGPVTITGSVDGDAGKTYEVVPFEVAPGTTRVEVAYGWEDLPETGDPITGPLRTVVDLGLWDHAGYRDVEGFRGWSGSRQGRVAAGQDPVVIQQDTATRGYRPAPVEPGTWWVELGFAVVAPTGARWEVTVTCTAPDVGAPFAPSPVDPTLVLRDEPGWYHADLHAHGYHSAGDAPPWDEIVEQARVAGLDVLPVTEYVVGQHWDELGAVQDRTPDLLLWPGREIITYHGHAVVLGETRSVLEYRHGFEDVTMADIQAATVAEGAAFQVAHPTFFPGPLANLCRGCEYTLDASTDWDEVTSIEVLTGPVLATSAEAGGPDDELAIENPFLPSAVQLWEDLLQHGYRITAVSGSDSKANEPEDERARRGIGSSATAIHATSLSRPALEEGLRAGRAYVRTLGADHSPELEVTATAPDGATAGIGDDLPAEEASLEVTVRHGEGDQLQLIRNGDPLGLPIAVTADPFTTTVAIERDPGSEGPLGTWVRVETRRPVPPADELALPLPDGALERSDHSRGARAADTHDDGTAADDHHHQARPTPPVVRPSSVDGVVRFPTTIANPVFLTGAVDPGGDDGAGDGADDAGDGTPGDATADGAGEPDDGRAGQRPTAALPTTGPSRAPSLLGLALLAGAALLVTRRAAARG